MVTLQSSGSYPTLLPYLQGSGKDLRLRLSLAPERPEIKSNAFPFAVLDDTGAVCRLVEARFETDSGSLLKKVVLVIQKDVYAINADSASVFSNDDVDASWQSAHNRRARYGLDSFTNLTTLIDASGRLLRQQSLFYCRNKQIFFHPSCPACGTTLTLCTDDDILGNTGLDLYSRSLKRYLYCAACSGVEKSSFYLFERGNADPIDVGDCGSLIRQWGRSVSDAVAAHSLPCQDCPEHAACFGEPGEVRNVIVPFSFYPFYVMMYDAPTVHSLDFMQLVAGASFEDIERQLDQRQQLVRLQHLEFMKKQGAGRKMFFNGADARAFLEILFLKITLLLDLVKNCVPVDDGSLVMIKSDSVWVNLELASGNLPTFWNFNVNIVDDVAPVPHGFRMSAAGVNAYGFAMIGYFWFQVLLQNSLVGQRKIQKSVTSYLAKKEEDESAGDVSAGLRELCQPANNFWVPEIVLLPQEWSDYWYSACEKGEMLLDAARTGLLATKAKSFLESLMELQAGIKKSLFAVNSAAVANPCEYPDTVNKKLEGILSNLVEKNRTGLKEKIAPPNLVLADEESMETVILSPAQMDNTAATVVMAPPQQATSEVPTAPEPPSAGNEEMMETVLLSPHHRSDKVMEEESSPVRMSHHNVDPSPQLSDDDQLCATVLYAPQKETAHAHGLPERGEQPPLHDYSQPNFDDQLAETVVIIPQPGKKRPQGFK